MRRKPTCSFFSQIKKTLAFTRCSLQVVMCSSIPSNLTSRSFHDNICSCHLVIMCHKDWFSLVHKQHSQTSRSTAMKRLFFWKLAYLKVVILILRLCPWENTPVPYSAIHRLLLNLAQMLGLLSERLWQQSGSKYFITFKFLGHSVKMPFDTNLCILI